MVITEAFIIDVLAVVNEELAERGIDPEPRVQLYVVETWIQDYEEIAPLHRLDKRCLNTLQAVRDHLHRQIKSTHVTV